MKKNKIVFGLLFGILLFAGCNKKDVTPTNQNAPKPLFTQSSWGAHTEWSDVSESCPNAGNNCFDPVIVNSPQHNAYVDFQTAVSEGSSAIGDYFTNGSWATIFPGLAADEGDNAQNINYLHELQTGNYSIITVTVGSTNYYLAGTGTFNESNPEFVLVVNE